MRHGEPTTRLTVLPSFERNHTTRYVHAVLVITIYTWASPGLWCELYEALSFGTIRQTIAVQAEKRVSDNGTLRIRLAARHDDAKMLEYAARVAKTDDCTNPAHRFGITPVVNPGQDLELCLVDFTFPNDTSLIEAFGAIEEKLGHTLRVTEPFELT